MINIHEIKTEQNFNVYFLKKRHINYMRQLSKPGFQSTVDEEFPVVSAVTIVRVKYLMSDR